MNFNKVAFKKIRNQNIILLKIRFACTNKSNTNIFSFSLNAQIDVRMLNTTELDRIMMVILNIHTYSQRDACSYVEELYMSANSRLFKPVYA